MKFLSFIFSLTAIFAFSIVASAQTTFSNSTPIAIADASPTTGPGIGNPYPSTISVSGLTGTVTDVNVRVNGLTHTFPDDIALMLVAPNNAFMVIQSDAGGGENVDNLTYTLDDQAAAGIPNAGPLTAGSFKPSSFGDDEFFPLTGVPPPPQDCAPFDSGECPQAAPAGSATLNGIFSGVNPNGVWRLYAVDAIPGDAGSITGGWSIVITTSGGGNPTPGDANVDFNGDGKTDYVVLRATDTALTEATAVAEVSLSRGLFSVRERLAEMRDRASKPQEKSSFLPPRLTWYTSINGTGTTSVGQIGDSEFDFPVPEDYDGDGKDDLAVWRAGAPNQAAFYIYQSSTNTVRTEIFGQTNDDPQIVGDYDGDNKADPAVFRCPTTTPGQCYFYFLGSLNNPNRITTFVPWGFGVLGNYFVNPGDFDGDGKYDFCLQRTRPGTVAAGQFVLLKSNGFGVEYIDWGNDNDTIVPGDYDGDGKSDFCVSRNESINGVAGLSYYILERDGGGTGASPIRWGVAGDVITPGDYDGDGKQDIAVWRENANPALNFFYIRRSSDGAFQSFEWGRLGDLPAANWYVH